MNRWLNYHHLYYFWNVARRGSISEVCKDLRLSQPTISAQLKSLEDSLGEQLFVREGRRLSLTDTGRLAFRYAEDIFALGNELLDAVEEGGGTKQQTLRVGIADVVPKFIAYQLLRPVLEMRNPPRIVCYEDKPERLLSLLATHEVDMILSDSPSPGSVKVKAFNHFLGESPVSVMGAETLQKTAKREFPESLNGSPVILPLPNAAVRKELERWLESHEIAPRIIGELEDRALMKIFAQAGAGFIFVPKVVEEQLRKNLGLRVLGRIEEVSEEFYLISLERKVRHPSVVAICENARKGVFKIPSA